MKLFAALAASAVLLQPALAEDSTATTKDVKVQYTGSSGGFRMSLVGDDMSFIKISQSKVEECDSTGKAVSPGWQFTPTNGNWATTTDSATGVTTTTYTKQKDAMKFQMVTMLTESTKDVFDPVVNKTVTVPANKLKFSVVAEGFTFTNAANSMCYSIDVQSKAGKNAKSNKSGNTFSQGGAEITTETTCTVDGKPGTVTVSDSVTGQVSSIDFKFPSFTNKLAYDPTISVSSAWATAPSVLAVSLVSALAYLQL